MRAAASAALAGLAAAPVLLVAAPALAEERDLLLTVDASAWSWRRVTPAAVPEPSNVPAGDLAVAFDGRPDAAPAKATYLRLALTDVPDGARALGLTLVLPLDPSVDQDATTAPLVACRMVAAFTTGEAVDPAVMPEEDCTEAAPGVYDATTGAVSFGLTTAAVEWLSGAANHGVVVRPAPTAAVPTVLPFQLVFKGASAVSGRLSVDVLAVPAPLGGPSAPAFGTPALPPMTGSAPLPALVPVPVPAPQAVAPRTAPVPQAAPSAVPAFTGVRAAQSRVPDRASAAGLATTTLLLLMLLLLVGWASGSVTDPRAFARAERRRLDRLRVGPVLVPALVVPQVMQSRQGRKPMSSAASGVV